MGELERRSWAVAGRTVGNSLAPGVAALCALAGLPPAEATFLSAAVGSMAEEGVGLLNRLHESRRDRVRRFAETAATAEPLDDLLSAASADPRKLELLAQALDAVTRSLGDWKVDLLARVFVAGTRDDARIDQAVVLIEVIRQLEVPHLRVLSILSGPGPTRTTETPVSHWVIPARQVWLVQDILKKDQEIEDAFQVLVARLQGLGLVTDERVGGVDFEPLWQLSPFGWQCVDYLTAHGTGQGGSGSRSDT